MSRPTTSASNRPGTAMTSFTMMTNITSMTDQSMDDQDFEVEERNWGARRAELETMSFAKELQPLALSHEINVFGQKKSTLIDMIIKHEEKHEKDMKATLGMNQKDGRKARRELEAKNARKKFELGRNKLTGYSMEVQSCLEQRVKLAHATRVMDLANVMEASEFQLGLREIPDVVFEAFSDKAFAKAREKLKDATTDELENALRRRYQQIHDDNPSLKKRHIEAQILSEKTPEANLLKLQTNYQRIKHKHPQWRKKVLLALWLTNNKIARLPGKISALHSVMVLGLGGNKLATLHPAVCQMTHLEELHLENNFIEKLPAEIVRLRKLHVLDLDHNRIHSFQDEITRLHGLRRLSMCNNFIHAIPAEIRRLRNLIELNLDHNKIGPSLPQNMWRLCGTLRVLGLQHNHLDNEMIFSNGVIQRLTGLTILRLGGNRGEAYEVVHPLSGMAVPGETVPTRLIDGYWKMREGMYRIKDGTPVYVEEDLEGYIHASVDYNVDNGRWYKEFNTEIYDMICNRARQRKLGLGL